MVELVRDNMLTEEFQNVSTQYRPRIRWWIPGTLVTEKELINEINSMKKAGFGGAEICPMPIYDEKEGVTKIDWGNERWNYFMKKLLHIAGQIDFTIDFTMTPGWPLALPTIKNVDDPEQGAQMELDGAFIDGISRENPFCGAVPISTEAVEDAKKVGGTVKLLTVTVAKYIDKTNKIISFESAKMLKIGEDVKKYGEGDTSYVVTYSPEDEGEYVLFAWWQHPSGEQTCGYNQLDHYGKAGTAQLIDFWEKNMIPYYKDDFTNITSLFIDSLEFQTHLDWTVGFLEKFYGKNGYDFTKYLPAVYDQDCRGVFQKITIPDFKFDKNNEQLKNDFKEFLTYLYVENHLKPITDFCERNGVKLRYQTAYGKELELAQTAMYVSIPETETLYGKDIIDFYRLQSGAVHMQGKPIYSIEASAEWNGRGNGDENSGNYQQGFKNQLWHIQRAFAGGVNQVVFHGYSYNGHYDGENNDKGAIPGIVWPGYEGMNNSYGPSNSWGERQPNWIHAKQYTDFIARNQFILRQGIAKVDLAIYAHRYFEVLDDKGPEKIYEDSILEQSGYTYDFVSPVHFNLLDAEVTNGRLNENGPAYKAIILNNQEHLPLHMAEKLLEYSKKNYPIIMIGKMPDQPSFLTHGSITTIIEELLKQKSVRQVNDIEEVPLALREMNILPDVLYDGRKKILNVHRKTEKEDVYYFYNYGDADNYRMLKYDEKIECKVSVKGNGIPYMLNTWTGEAMPIPVHSKENGLLVFNLKLTSNDSTVILVTEEEINCSTFDKNYNVSEIQGKFYLKDWELSVEKWAAGILSIQTEKEILSPVKMEFTMPWSKIKGYENVSGIGYYRTSFYLEKGWNENAGAVLILGRIEDSFHIIINGNKVVTNQIDTTIDIGRFTIKGQNHLEIVVASTLLNAVVTHNNQNSLTNSSSCIDKRKLNDHGIIDKVCVIPYVWQTLD